MWRLALSDRAGAFSFLAAGGEAEPPDPDEAVERFEAALATEPQQVDPEQADLLVALGLRGG